MSEHLEYWELQLLSKWVILRKGTGKIVLIKKGLVCMVHILFLWLMGNHFRTLNVKIKVLEFPLTKNLSGAVSNEKKYSQ